MLEDKEGVAAAAISKHGPETLASVLRCLRKAQVRLPSVSPPPDEVFLGGDMKKVLNAATKMQKAKGDGYLGADVLFLALLDSKEMGAALSEAGANKSQVAAAVEAGRGTARVDSATADTQFEALAKYGVDLTAKAAELDPVIGRDEEIRCASFRSLHNAAAGCVGAHNQVPCSAHRPSPAWARPPPLTHNTHTHCLLAGASSECCAAAPRTTRCSSGSRGWARPPSPKAWPSAS